MHFLGFATYVEYIGTEHAFPEARIWDQFLTIDLHRAFEVDALQSTKAITNVVTNPSYDSFFTNGLTTIVYSKGNVF